MGAKFGKPLDIVDETLRSNTMMEPKAEKNVTGEHKEIENQFNDIYKRSNEKLDSLIKNPGKELEERVVKSLTNNPLKMENCFDVIDTCKESQNVTEDPTLLMLERVAIIEEN